MLGSKILQPVYQDARSFSLHTSWSSRVSPSFSCFPRICLRLRIWSPGHFPLPTKAFLLYLSVLFTCSFSGASSAIGARPRAGRPVLRKLKLKPHARSNSLALRRSAGDARTSAHLP
eukprot:6198054-Pleurochrysis_carterae.AAC.3